MYKKLLISITLFVAFVFSFTVCFANNNVGQDMVNGVRDFVGGAENAIEGAVNGVSNATRNATGAMENTANNIGNTIMDNGNNKNTTKDTNNNNMMGNTGMNTDYTATRTATDATFMGMGATTWTWLIIGIAGIAIIALVWYYSMQLRSSNYENKD